MIDDNRLLIHEKRSTRWVPPAVAVHIGNFRPLQEPIRLQDLLNSARSRAEKKDKRLYLNNW